MRETRSSLVSSSSASALSSSVMTWTGVDGLSASARAFLCQLFEGAQDAAEVPADDVGLDAHLVGGLLLEEGPLAGGDEVEAVEKPARDGRGRREEVALAAGFDADGKASTAKCLLQAADAVAPVFVAEERLVVVDELADLFFFSGFFRDRRSRGRECARGLCRG